MDVKGLRAQQAEATKDRVAEAARAVFVQRGYAGATVSAISAASGVPEQTIYSAFGGKAQILSRVTQLWMRDTRTRERAEAYLRESDPARRLRQFAVLNRVQLDAGADVLEIYREAARNDASMAAALHAMLRAREGEIAHLVASLRPGLRRGLSVDDAHAVTLALSVDAVYATLRAAGWTGTRYQKWLGDALVAQLLAPGG